ncbi:MAG: DUF4870 domain-containing protein [Pirellulales bacterium]|nr:DUF4870 domain-containing protein [Pirellulales bacterium]
MSIPEELQKLQQLHQSGTLNDEEYTKAKAALLDGQQPVPPQAEQLNPTAKAQQINQWAMFIHLSLLAGFVVPFAGLVLPIVIWQVKKPEMPELDVHGEIVVNWIISLVIYSILSALLCFVFVGFLLFLVLMVVAVVFPIIGGVKASNGEVWKYPLSISFLK